MSISTIRPTNTLVKKRVNICLSTHRNTFHTLHVYQAVATYSAWGEILDFVNFQKGRLITLEHYSSISLSFC